MSSTRIDKRIVKYRVLKPEDKAAARTPRRRRSWRTAATAAPPKSSACTRRSSAPEMLIGSTYKIKTPVSDHAMYVTINDIVLNEGTEYEQRRPFEVFINSKNLDHFQWIVALTRIISAVFRKGGDVAFLVDELKAVFDPRGGYWQPGGKFMPSIIAELGYVIEKHLQSIGLMRKTELDVHQKKLVEDKRAEFEARARQQDAFAKSHFPMGAQLCSKVQHGGRRHDGRLHDLPELRRVQVRLSVLPRGSGHHIIPPMKRLLLLCILLLLARFATAADTLLPRPPELEPDVQFWIRVYTQVSTNEGLIHDQHRLSVVYETLHFDADMPSSERAQGGFEREARRGDPRHLARGEEPRDDDDRRVRKLWGDDATPAQLEEAASDVRFQLGQSDRFRAGLVRSGAWEPHIAEVLANLGLPAEIAALPHVESSFDPYAYSKVGAAGLWQFMRSTGRRFLRIDAAVDERLDPYRETEAAAQLLSYNYRLLGSWPLAITAYNHGAEGVRRARELLGTDDIVRIVRDYHSPSFGFASRNFYVSFLAALSIAQDPEKYFGGVVRDAEFGFAN
jgi:hypothetical protein